MERAANFKKVLDVFFGGSPPQVGSGAGSSGSGSSGSSPSGSGSSGGSSDKWYPDYNPQFSQGKCINEAPLPSGRPSYDTGADCCGKAYSGQASNVCLSSLPQSPPAQGGTFPDAPSGISPFPPAPRPTRQPVSPTSDAGMIVSSQTFIDMERTLEDAKVEIDSKLFLYQTPGYQWIESVVYRYDDFMDSLYVMATEGVAGKTFYIGERAVDNGHVYGLVNIAAFLAQVRDCISNRISIDAAFFLISLILMLYSFALPWYSL